MNKVIQTVTLCADPESRPYNNGEGTIVSFNGAVNKRFVKEGEPNADFFQYTAFGKTAEFIMKYFKKGSKMLMTGEVNNNNYTDKEGKKVYGTKILIDNVEFFGTKKDNEVSGDSSQANGNASATAANNTSSPAEASASSYDSYEDF